MASSGNNQIRIKRGFPKIPVYKAATDFIQSKKETATFRCDPEWDVSRQGPELALLGAENDLAKINGLLGMKRKEMVKTRKNLEQQWTDLRSKEEQLKENFVRFSSFVKGNQDKRERAVQRSTEEKKIIKMRTEMIEEVTTKLERLREVKQLLDENISKHRVYEKYLEDVVLMSADFKNVFDLINRYEALQMARQELTERQELGLGSLETARSAMMKLIEENTFLIMGLFNTVAQLNSRYNKAVAKSMKWDQIVTSIRNNTDLRFRDIMEVKLGAWNMYQMMCKRKKVVPEFAEGDFENHLIFIKKTLQELRTINATFLVTSKKKLGSTSVVISTSSK